MSGDLYSFCLEDTQHSTYISVLGLHFSIFNLSFFKRCPLFLIMCIDVSLCRHMSAAPSGATEGIGSSGAGVIGSSELPSEGSGN